MYEYPFGAGQQLNLNWIISEIIQLHKQLDPDYVAPTFDNTFPFTNLNVLNLDWILKELKTIKDLAPTEDATLLKMVANALIAATYNPDNSYQENDIVYRDNERRIYACINDTTGAWVDADWFEIKIGDVLTALLNVSFNLSASAIANDSGVTGDTVADALNNLVEDVKYETGYLKQKKNGTYSNVIAVEDTPSNNSDRLASSKAAYDLKDAINGLLGNRVHHVNASGNFSGETNTFYTGISVTIPANSFYVVQGNALYISSAPIKAMLGTSDSNSNAAIATGNYSFPLAACTTCGYTSGGLTIYLWAEYNATGSESGAINGFYITI